MLPVFVYLLNIIVTKIIKSEYFNMYLRKLLKQRSTNYMA